ncbi:pullulanase-type alpha-1,6-glucosidase [Arthrobacter alpinus]|uniref:pullulanase-type alpha-1,6-glucosidase n=1 Tax=Arthrobacter alpinus TaxID=656366 RepID=UPI0009F827A5|nr:pullulanase-type alpha-1,6-glucosidase [Arthrobacter alpinus]
MTDYLRARRVLALAFSGALAASALLAPSFATGADAADGRVFTLAGDLQDELGCAADWAPDCPETKLVETGTAGVYAADFTLPAGSFNYKVAVNESWDEAYGHGSENIPLALAGESRLRVTFDDTTKRIGVQPLELRGDYSAADDALVKAPVRQAGAGENFYFVMTDRFDNGDTSNDEAGIEGGRLLSGYDPSDKGFYNGGDIAGLRNRLDYIEGLGTTAIWLTPSFKNRPVQGEGADASAGYHGYWVTDFTQIDPHLGTNEELSALIDEAHAKGIKVYFDIITNHTADVIANEQNQNSYLEKKDAPYKDAAGAPFDPAHFAGTDRFPDLDPATSFPYTPKVQDADANLKVPAWLNDTTLYHNRGDSIWSGESETYGDFSGLDDLMTEHPKVVDGFVEVFQDWVDFGIDGFRIDTVKHVNLEFWQKWTTGVLDYAHANGKEDFFMFGEVYSADQKILSPYVRKTDMNSVLDFAFQDGAVGYATGNSARGLQTLFAGDDYFTTTKNSPTALPTFLGNHDMGRVGYFANNTANPLERDELAHELLYLTRGQPVIYYGDEQGFAGDGDGKDKNSRQSLFGTQVAEYAGQKLVTGETIGTADRFDTEAPLYQHIAALAKLRADHPALAQGAQIQRYADDGAGIYAFSRVDRDEKVEYLVALNNATEEKSVAVTTLTQNGGFEPLYGADSAVKSDGKGATTITVPAMSAVVYRADKGVTASATDIALNLPAAGAALTGSTAVSATIDQNAWAETSFAYRVVGGEEWMPLGTSESAAPRVFHDSESLPAGTLVEYRAVTTDAAGNHSAASSYGSAGFAVTTEEVEAPEAEITMVSVPGSHNVAMGCAADWQPACETAKLTKNEDGIYTGTFELPAGSYEYKVAMNGSWDLAYGSGGDSGGGAKNLMYTHDGGPVTFYWNPATKIAQNSSQSPIITLAGDFQKQLGCSEDWKPACFATSMDDSDGDGVYEFSTGKLAAGNYSVKAAHGLGWDENYGVGGAPGGENLAFSASTGKQITFRYTLATHILEIGVADPPLAGLGTLQAKWIDENTLAWPAALLGQVPAANASWKLFHSASAALMVTGGAVSGGSAIDLSYDSAGFSAEQLATFPSLKTGYIVLRPAALDQATTAGLLKEQLQIAQTRDGALDAYTGVQLPGVLDSLYAGSLAGRTLGIKWSASSPSFTLWAPTAQKATLLTWPADGSGEPARTAATWDAAAGTWTAAPNAIAENAHYLWEVDVYAHSTGKVETNQVTDPYSIALTTNSTRSIAVDLDSPAWAPEQWATTAAPVIEKQVDRSIYELHARDFSIGDTTVPEEERGTYRAFTRDSAGTAQLRELAAAGINTVHLLPTFDLATIEENRAAQKTPDCDLASFGAGSEEQQACAGAVANQDGYNWGYDPLHFQVPEGSYAVDPAGGARVAEFREMVGALHATGLQVVLDQVFNHTAASGQAGASVLDKVVPGYYQRLNADGKVETSTCCENVATEHKAAEKLMVDSVVLWAREYKVDGFRFDLMAHHSKANMLAVRAALDELTVEKDGVDGKSILLYGEGWNFGEVADNALFEQASQGQLAGTSVGTFSDRLRDAVHGGSPVAGETKFQQGFGTGLATDPNGSEINGTPEQALAELQHQTDVVKLGLAGDLSDYSLTTSDGTVAKGAELDYRGSPAGYASQPDEIISYVDAHDNETLFDIGVLKLPADTTMADRVRMNTLSLATATLAQTPSFWHAGTELLRSKSLDRNSYNSGDWFNRIDWTGQESTFGSGLPPKADNGDHWASMKPLLENAANKPQPADISAAEAGALDLLRLRSSIDLLRLGSAELISQKVSFPGSGTEATPGVIVMSIDDLVGDDADPALDGALVVFNAGPDSASQTVGALAGRDYALSPVQSNGLDPVVKQTSWDVKSGTVSVPARTVAVLVNATADEPSKPGSPDPGPGTDPTEPVDPGGNEGPGGTTDPSVPGTVLATDTPSAEDHLASTGVNFAVLAGVAVLMLLAGMTAFRVARRRKAGH